jgi:phosphate transport system permease protein
MLRLVPRSFREGSLALGATKSQTIFRVVLPSATGSIVTGTLLAVARIAGETAPLLFTAGYSRFLSTNPNEPFPSLTIQIYQAAQSPFPAQQRMAWAGMLVLIVLFLFLSISIRLVAQRSVRVAT